MPHRICFQKSFILLSLFILAVYIMPAESQPTLAFQNDKTVTDAVWQIEQLMAGPGPASLGCKLPIRYSSSADQLKDKHGQPVDDPEMQLSLMQQLMLDPYKGLTVTFFDGYVTRLFDTPSTNWIFGALTDQELLGVVQQSTDPNALLMWGLSSSIVKYDCTSLLKIAAKADAKYSYLNIASLQASFDGSQSSQSSKSVIILTGHAQSLFDVYFANGTPSQRLFAALQAIHWYELPLVKDMTEKRLQHLTEAQVISFASTENIDSSQNIAANLSASLNNIPIVAASASGSISYQLSNAFQQMSKSFKTFYFNANASLLPPLTTVVSTAIAAISLNNATANTATSTPAVFPGGLIQIKGDVSGWPSIMCTDGLWSGSVTNTTSFTYSGAHLQPAPTGTDGIPVCTLQLSAKVNGSAPSGQDDPGFALTYKTDSTVLLKVPFPQSLSAVNIVTQPTFNVTGITSIPPAIPQPLTLGAQVTMLWSLNGYTVNNDQTISKYKIDPGTSCSWSDGSQPTVLNSIFATSYGSMPSQGITFGTSSATTDTVNNPSTYQTVWLSFLADSNLFDVFAPASAYKSCTLKGILKMTINGSSVDSAFSTKVPFPPARGQMSAKSLDCAQPTASPKTISISASASGATCTVYGTNLDLVSQINLSGDSGVQLTLALTMLKDSSQAKFVLLPADIAKLKAGSTYGITLTPSSGAAPVNSAATFLAGP